MSAPNPPEYKRYRLVVWATYVVIASVFSLFLIVSVVRQAILRVGVSPELAAVSAVDDEARRFCLKELESVQAELNGRLDALTAVKPARLSAVEWEDWSPAWRGRLLAAGARCRLSKGDAPGTVELKEAYERLGELHRTYTTLSIQYAKETGPYADRVVQAMESARKAVRGGP